MGKLNISRNIFLEKEELNRFQDFLLNDTIASIFLDNTNSWGVVRTIFGSPSTDFLVEVGTNLGTIKIANLSKAVDKDRLLIYQEPIDNIPVTPDNSWYWVKISHKYDNLEVGECSININGEVSGINTKFSEVLRGHATQVPVKVKFYKPGGSLLNDQIYEVLSLNNSTPDLNMILVGNEFYVESGLRYSVIGSTPIFESITAQQEQGLYFYDSCQIDFVLEEVEDTAPVTNYIVDKEFYIARVRNSAGTITIQDKRTQFWAFNIEGMSNKLDRDNNLSDLTNVESARNNLGVLSAVQISNIYFHDSGWKPMTNGIAASSANFDLKLRRIGRLCIIQGTFMGGSDMSPNTMIASIPYVDFAYFDGTLSKHSEKIYFFAGMQIGSEANNRGCYGYVRDPGVDDSFLQLMVDSAYQMTGHKMNINISFFVE